MSLAVPKKIHSQMKNVLTLNKTTATMPPSISGGKNTNLVQQEARRAERGNRLGLRGSWGARLTRAAPDAASARTNLGLYSLCSVSVGEVVCHAPAAQVS